MELSYILNHLGENRDEYYGAVAPPIFQTTNFAFPSVSVMRDKLTRELETPFYTRGFNPTVAVLRQKIAALEGTEDCLVFSSGSAAVAAAVMSVVKSGDHVVCVKKPYSWTGNLISKYLAKYGVTHTFTSGNELADFERAVTEKTRLIYLESPNSLTFEMQDIEAISRFARSKNIVTIIDNSYNSPLNQQPAALGADLVVHSGSKYLNGHSDVVCGVVCGSRDRIMRMFAEEYMTIGSCISPQDAGLILRGLRTLPLRVDRSSASAQKVAEFLQKHPKIKQVNYPFLPSNPQFSLAKKQMRQGGGLLSIILDAKDLQAAERFADNLKCFLMATSWGGYESLVFPLCALAASKSFENPLPWNMMRLYIGLEDPDELIRDLEQALDKM